jgi:Cu(I)/Ag(I) efflux system membrane protein CusA/SilA
MELTGIKTPLGLKVQGPSVDGIEQPASKMQTVLSSMPQVRSIFAERISQGF